MHAGLVVPLSRRLRRHMRLGKVSGSGPGCMLNARPSGFTHGTTNSSTRSIAVRIAVRENVLLPNVSAVPSRNATSRAETKCMAMSLVPHSRAWMLAWM
jgi:hypothetical protein